MLCMSSRIDRIPQFDDDARQMIQESLMYAATRTYNVAGKAGTTGNLLFKSSQVNSNLYLASLCLLYCC